MTERTPGHPGSGQSDTRRRTGEPAGGVAASWAVLVASFGLSAATWIALARLSGFTGQVSVLGITVALAWLMPVAIDGYVVTALVLWMAPVPAKVAAFARKNTYAAASVGVAAQSAFHSLSVLSATNSTWRAVMAAVVGALPPAVAALAVHMRALIRRESGQADTDEVQRTSDSDADLPADTRTPKPAAEPDTPSGQADTTERTPAPDINGHVPAAAPRTVVDISEASARRRSSGQVKSADTVSVETLADTLGKAFKDEKVGAPRALAELRRVYGSCSRDRAIAAKDLHNARREANTPPSGTDADSDDQERELVVAR